MVLLIIPILTLAKQSDPAIALNLTIYVSTYVHALFICCPFGFRGLRVWIC